MARVIFLSPRTFDSGKTVSINGSGFGTSTGTVTIGGVTQTIQSWTDATIVITTVRGSQSMGECQVVVTPVDNPDPVSGLLFTDTFESGGFSTTQNGVSWGSRSNVTNQAGRGVGGSRSAQFAYAGSASGGDATAECRFDLGAYYRELTIKFDLYIPNGSESWGGAAYAHRGDSPNNNKFFRLWPTTYDDQGKVGASTFAQSGFSSINTEYNRGSGMGEYVANGNARSNNFITSADLGTWMAIQIYVKAPTSTTLGTVRIHKNGSVAEMYDGITYHSTAVNGYRYGYLLGWSNSGFASTTYLQIDNVRFYSGDAT